MSEDQRTLTILNLPEVALEKILSYLSYDELANKRLVCSTFNKVCGGLLTKGFIHLEKKHASIYRIVKGLLPRRPSERRTHLVVSRYSEILQGMETRIRMLSVTYMRYVEQHFVYFIPGKVLDEIQRLLNLIEQKFNPPNNSNTLLEELRDLSSMAMEHFDEHILPIIQRQEKGKPNKIGLLCNEILRMKRRNRVQKHYIVYWAGKVHSLSNKVSVQNLRLKKMTAKIREQNSKLQVQSTKMANHELMISTLQKQMETLQQNYLDLKIKMENEMNTANTSQNTEIIPAVKPLENTNTPLMLSKTFAKLLHYDKVRQKTGLPSTFGAVHVLDPIRNRVRKIRDRPQELSFKKERINSDLPKVEESGYIQSLHSLKTIKRHNENMRALIRSQLEYQKKNRQKIVSMSRFIDKINKNKDVPESHGTFSAENFDLKQNILQDVIGKGECFCLDKNNCFECHSPLIRKRKSLHSDEIPLKVSRDETEGPKLFDNIRGFLNDIDQQSFMGRKRKSESENIISSKNPALNRSLNI